MSEMRLGVVVYRPGSGAGVDRQFADVAGALRRSGWRVAGAVQHNIENPSSCRCDMTLEDLSSGALIEISEDRGPEARACRLDACALEEIAGLVAGALDRGTDLVIVNKFGKREVEGGGFRQVIERAAALGVPLLVAVSRDNLEAWERFAAGADTRLPADQRAISAWCRSWLGTSLTSAA